MKIMLMFGGQGTADPDLFKLIQSNTIALDYLRRLSQAVGYDLTEKIREIGNPHFSQCLIGAYQLSLYAAVADLLVAHQTDVSGYSLGEVSAFLVSTDATPELAMEVLAYRSKLLTALSDESTSASYDLLSVKGTFDLQAITLACEPLHCYVAIKNSDRHLILGGTRQALEALLTQIPVEKAKFLSIHLPSHTPLYRFQANKFKTFLEQKITKIRLGKAIISPIALGKVYTVQQECELLDNQLYNPLDWQSVCHLINEYHYDLIIDMGPGDAMSRLLLDGQHSPGKAVLLRVSDFASISGIRDRISSLLPTGS